MSRDSYREGDPDAAAVTRRNGRDIGDNQAIPSIERSRRWECTRYCLLVLASPSINVVAHLLRTGRDLTHPVFVSVAAIIVVGLTMAVVGLRQRDLLRSGFGAANVFISLGVAYFSCSAILWSGSTIVTFTFVVIDANTGKPVPNAVVSLSRRKEDVVVSTTDANGMVSISYRCWASGRSSWVSDTGGASFSGIDLMVHAKGYLVMEEEIISFCGLGWIMHGPPPDTAQIRLEPQR